MNGSSMGVICAHYFIIYCFNRSIFFFHSVSEEGMEMDKKYFFLVLTVKIILNFVEYSCNSLLGHTLIRLKKFEKKIIKI